VYLATDAVIDNRSEFLIRSHSSGIYRTGAAPQRFINNAVVRRTGPGSSPINVSVENYDWLGVIAGTVRINYESEHVDATLHAAAGASLLFDGGTHTISGKLEGEPEGDVIHSATMIAGENGAAIDFGGTGFQWSAGTLDGSHGLVNEARLVVTGGSNKTLRGELTNEATIDWTQGHVYFATGAALDNRGLFTASAGSGLYRTGAAPQRFDNTGSFVKLANETTSVIDVAFRNRASLNVKGGVLRFSHQSDHEDVTLAVGTTAELAFTSGTHLLTNTSLDVPAGATAIFAGGTRIVTGALSATPQGVVRWTGGTMAAGAGGGTFQIGEAGLEWQGGNVASPTADLSNAGIIHMTGSAAKTVSSGTFRNEGDITWTQGQLNIAREATFRNSGSMTVDIEQVIIGPSFSPGRFLNEGLFARTAGGGIVDVYPRFENGPGARLAADSGTIRLRRFANAEGGTMSGRGGTIAMLDGSFVNNGVIAPGASPGLLNYVGTLRSGSTSELQIELGGNEAGSSYDRLAVEGSAQLGGRLRVRLIDGFRPSEGASFSVLTSTTGLQGGFSERIGLVDADAAIALFPSVHPNEVVLTAGPLQTLAAEISMDPSELDAGARRAVTITGSGFAPDISVSLECVQCEDPVGFGTIPGEVGTMTAGQMEVWFDLSRGRISGDYRLIIRDPRGGEASTDVIVNEGPLFLTVDVLKEASLDGRDPGMFVVRANRTLRESMAVPFTFYGNGEPYIHFMTDIIGASLTIPSGQDSVLMNIFPIGPPGSSDRSVGLRLEYDQPSGGPTTSASMVVRGGSANPGLQVFGSSPQSGGNRGTVTISVAGTGFSEAATVTMTGGPSGTLHPLRVEVNATGTLARATFEVSGQAVGPRHIALTDGSQEIVLANAFRFDAAIYPTVHVQLLAPPRVPRTRERTYTIVLHNEGNVDVSGHAILSGLPNNAEWDVKWDEIPGPGGRTYRWRDIAPVYKQENHMVIEFPTVVLGAGESRRIEITAAILDPQQMELIAGWIYR
jgi:hypothetical protein